MTHARARTFFSEIFCAVLHTVFKYSLGFFILLFESELVTCISQGHIQAKIDSHNKVVQAVDPDEEGDLFDEISNSGKAWTRETKAM